MPVASTVQEDLQPNKEPTFKDLYIKLKTLYHYIKSKWILILIIGIIGAALGYFYANSKDPMFTATTSFVLESNESESGLSQYAGIASMVGVDLNSGGGIFQQDNIVALYQSRSMIQKTLLRKVMYAGKPVTLADHYIAINDLRKDWLNKPQLKDISFNNYLSADTAQHSRLKDSLLGAFVADINKKYLEVGKLDKKLNIISVKIISSDEFFAKNFNEQIVENVNEFYIQTKTKKAMDNVSILTTKVDSVRAEMNGAIYRVAAIADATPNLNPTRQLQRTVPVQRSQFSAETNKEILGQLIKNLEMSKISLLKETPLIQVVDEPLYPLEVYVPGKLKYSIIGFIVFTFLLILFLAGRKFLFYLVK